MGYGVWGLGFEYTIRGGKSDEGRRDEGKAVETRVFVDKQAACQFRVSGFGCRVSGLKVNVSGQTIARTNPEALH